MAKTLTDPGIGKIKASDKRREIPDSMPGLYLVVQRTAFKSWVVRYRFEGKPRKLTLQPEWPHLGVADARVLATKAIAQAKGEDAADPAKQKREAKKARKEALGADRDNFVSVARKFILRHAKPKNRTWLSTARQLGLVERGGELVAIEPRDKNWNATVPAIAWGDRQIQDVTLRDVHDLLDAIVDRGAPVFANRTLAAIRKLMNWSLSRGIIASSPCAGIEPPSSERSRDRCLSDGEVREVWNAASKLGYPFGPMVQILLLTGQRLREVAHAGWSEIDLESRLWTLPRERAKTDRAHEVPLSAAALSILSNLPRFSGCDHLFTTNAKTPISGFSKSKIRLDRSIAEARKATIGSDAPDEMPDWRYHDLRRTFASAMARLNINLPVIERLLNHQSGSFAGVVGVYQHYEFTKEKREAIEVWGRFVTGLVNESNCGSGVELSARRLPS
jgi:integrase